MSSSYDRDRIYSLTVDSIAPNPWQPREDFEDDAIQNLAMDISENGQLQPILVRTTEDQSLPFQLVFGHRRLAACRRLGKKIQAQVVDKTDKEAIVDLISENIQRKNLNWLEEIYAIRYALDADVGLTQRGLAKSVGYSPPQMSNRLRLLQLPECLLRMASKRMAWTIARELLCFISSDHHRHDIELRKVYELLERHDDSTQLTKPLVSEAILQAIRDNGDRWRRIEVNIVETDAYRPEMIHTISIAEPSQSWTCDVEAWDRLQRKKVPSITRPKLPNSVSRREVCRVSKSELPREPGDIIIRNLNDRVQNLRPDEFESLVGEYLKAKGFSDVEVTGKSYDGGIDGHCGIPFINVKVAFQAKRYATGNNVGIEPVQRLQGSMSNTYDRGVFITTSNFTSAAKGWVQEAQAQITLIDGDELVEQMMELGLGVRTIPVVRHEVDEGFFADLENQ